MEVCKRKTHGVKKSGYDMPDLQFPSKWLILFSGRVVVKNFWNHYHPFKMPDPFYKLLTILAGLRRHVLVNLVLKMFTKILCYFFVFMIYKNKNLMLQKFILGEDIEITYSYWDGSGHRRTIKVLYKDVMYQMRGKLFHLILQTVQFSSVYFLPLFYTSLQDKCKLKYKR